MNHTRLLQEINKRLDYDRERGELRRKAGFAGVVAGSLIGSKDTYGRIQATFLGVRHSVHSLIWLIEKGCMPSGLIYHVNGDKSDNRVTNLRDVTRSDRGRETIQAITARIRKAVKYWKPSTAMPKEERLRRDRELRANNRDKYREIIRKSTKKHHEANKDNPDYIAAKSCRQILNRVVRAAKKDKTESTEATHGYTVEVFKNHIASQFEEWMHWGNHGEWHIDHIKPVSLFIAEGVTDPSIINALSNLHPLSAADNIRKGDRYAVSH